MQLFLGPRCWRRIFKNRSMPPNDANSRDPPPLQSKAARSEQQGNRAARGIRSEGNCSVGAMGDRGGSLHKTCTADAPRIQGTDAVQTDAGTHKAPAAQSTWARTLNATSFCRHPCLCLAPTRGDNKKMFERTSRSMAGLLPVTPPVTRPEAVLRRAAGGRELVGPSCAPCRCRPTSSSKRGCLGPPAPRKAASASSSDDASPNSASLGASPSAKGQSSTMHGVAKPARTFP